MCNLLIYNLCFQKFNCTVAKSFWSFGSTNFLAKKQLFSLVSSETMTFFQVVCLCALFLVAVIAESTDPEKELFELADLDFDNMGPDMSKPINIEVGA